jgi:hypothetical protein
VHYICWRFDEALADTPARSALGLGIEFQQRRMPRLITSRAMMDDQRLAHQAGTSEPMSFWSRLSARSTPADNPAV